MTSTLRERLLDFTRSKEREQLDFLTGLCEINSYTFNKTGADRVSASVIEKLQGIFPNHRLKENKQMGDHHILSTHKTGKAVHLLGHTDTVFPPDHVFQKCTTEGGWLKGPGTADMKGGLAAIVYALIALTETAGIEDIPLTLILGADEEYGSVTSRQIYEKERQNAFLCLVAECAGEKGEIVVSRHGKAGGRLQCFGRDRHVGSAEEEKDSAILEIAHKVIAFESLNGFRPGVRINVGRIEGGLGSGTVPGHAAFLFDARWKEEDHRSPLLEQLESITAKKENPQNSSQMEILSHRPAMPLTDKTERLFSVLRKTAEELGQAVSFEHRMGTSDANFFGSFGVPTLDGFGPIGVKDHTSEEKILVSSLTERTALLALFLYNLAENGFCS